jgi:hypothetical protein
VVRYGVLEAVGECVVIGVMMVVMICGTAHQEGPIYLYRSTTAAGGRECEIRF